MSDGIYVGMNAAAARAAQLDQVADNLANAQTPGFKATRPAFQTFLAQGPDAAPDQRHAAAVATSLDLSPGVMHQTGRGLDVLPDGNGFLAVRTSGGTLAYTRAGSLTVDSSGVLLAAGEAVLDEGGRTIAIPPGYEPTVSADGTVRAGDMNLSRLGTYALAGPVDRVGRSLVAPGEGGAALPVDTHLTTGVVELGNAGPLEAAVALVGAQRHFESAMQAVQTYRHLDERLNELGRVR